MDLDDLYQEILLDHARNPRNREPLLEADVLADERNPLCGDAIRIALAVENGRIANLRFDGHGCAISTASASLMTEYAQGRTVEEARAGSAQTVQWLKGESAEAGKDMPEEILALEGVRNFPMRIKCATMCWHALDHALERAGKIVKDNMTTA